MIENGEVIGRDGKPPIVCWSYDAAHIHRGMKQTSFGYKIVNLINAPDNSPHYFHEFCLMEAGDDHLSMREHVQGIVDEVNDIIEAGVIDLTRLAPLQDVSTALIHLGCADQAALHANEGQGGCNMPNPCCYCDVHRDELFSIDTEQIKNYTKRQSATNARRAHAVAGKCPSCLRDVVEPRENVKLTPGQVPLAAPRARVPTNPVRFKNISHALHKNQKIGQTQILKIPIHHWSICILHLHLRIVGMMFEHTVLRHTGLTNKSPGKDGDDSRTVAAHIYLLLIAAGIHVKMITPPSNDINQYAYSICKHGFHGSDASAIMTIWPVILEVLMPRADRDADSEMMEDFTKIKAVWEQWTEVWETIEDVKMERTMKADRVEERGLEWVTRWVSAFGVTTHLYPHLLTAHLPNQIRKLPIDPWYLSQQSAEHRHSLRKRWSFGANKHKPKPLDQRLTMVESYFRIDGKEVKAHRRSSGKCRAFQVLERSLLDDVIRDIFETPKSMAIRYERWKQRRARRQRRVMAKKAPMLATAQRTTDGFEHTATAQLHRDITNEISASNSENSATNIIQDSTPPPTDDDDDDDC